MVGFVGLLIYELQIRIGITHAHAHVHTHGRRMNPSGISVAVATGILYQLAEEEATELRRRDR